MKILNGKMLEWKWTKTKKAWFLQRQKQPQIIQLPTLPKVSLNWGMFTWASWSWLVLALWINCSWTQTWECRLRPRLMWLHLVIPRSTKLHFSWYLWKTIVVVRETEPKINVFLNNNICQPYFLTVFVSDVFPNSNFQLYFSTVFLVVFPNCIS